MILVRERAPAGDALGVLEGGLRLLPESLPRHETGVHGGRQGEARR